LTGVDKDEVFRGMGATHPGTLAPTPSVAVRLQILQSATDALEHGDEVKVHSGTSEVMARAAVLEADRIAPGSTGWVELRLAEPVAIAVGDRLVVRRPSPSETLGGGVVADASPVRARRRADAVQLLEQRVAPKAGPRLLAVLDVPRTTSEIDERSGLDAAARDAALRDAVATGSVVALGDAFVSRVTYEALATHAIRLCELAHRRTPLR